MLARLAFFVLLIAPPIALAADAPPGGKISVVAAAPARAAAAPAPALMSPLPAAATSVPQDASACRMDCSASYYTCRAGDDPDACGGGWSQCLAACNNPNLAPPTTSAP